MTPPRPAARHSAPWAVATVAAGIVFLYFAREVLIPLAFALTLSFLLTSPVSWLQKLGLNRVAAVAVATVLTLSAAMGTGWIAASQLLAVVNDLPRYRLNIRNKLESIRLQGKGALGRAAESLNTIEREISAPEQPSPPPSRNQPQGPRQAPNPPTEVQVVQQSKSSYESIYDFLNPLLRIMGTLGITVIFSMFMLVNREDLRNRILRLVGLGQLNTMTQAFDDATQRISRYLRAQFLVNAGFAALISLGLFAIGVPSAVLWGVVAGVFRLVPYVGILIAAALPLALSLAVFDGWWQPLMVFLLYAVTEIVLANFIEPMFYGSNTGISALALLVATVFWAALWGPAGLVLSAPLTVCVVVLGRHVPHLSFLHVLLGDEQVLEPQAQLFQRLLAMDQQEARQVVESFLKGKSLVELYDLLFIPALILVEQDRHKGNLDETRQEFVFLSIEEMVPELSSQVPAADASAESAAEPLVRRGGRVVCFAANDHADEIAAGLLAQLLEQAGVLVLCFPANASLDQLTAMLELGADDMICISAVPPFAATSARTLYQKLRRAFPRVKIVVGIWGFAGDPEKLKERFERDRPDILTSFSQALRYSGESKSTDSELQAVGSKT